MSRRQSLKNLSNSFSSESSLRGDSGTNKKHSSGIVNGTTSGEKDTTTIPPINDLNKDVIRSAARSVDDLKKELAKLTNKRLETEKTSISLKKPGTSSRRIEKPSSSFKTAKNYSSKNGLTRMDSRTSIGVRGTTATLIRSKKDSNELCSTINKTVDDEEQEIYKKWLENKDFFLQNPFSLEGFELDPPGSQTCCRCVCKKRSVTMSKAMIGKPAPQFQATGVVDNEFKTVKLSDYNGKFVVLFFYPRDFTFVCPTEICAFNDRSGEFRALNCEMIACSTDSEFSHFAWINQPRKQGGLGSMKIPVIADVTHQIAKDYGVYKEDGGLSYRGLFIIDKKGILRQIIINDLPIGRDVDETLRLLQAIQYTDEHGEACPVGWRPGKPAIKQGEAGRKYFENAS